VLEKIAVVLPGQHSALYPDPLDDDTDAAPCIVTAVWRTTARFVLPYSLTEKTASVRPSQDKLIPADELLCVGCWGGGVGWWVGVVGGGCGVVVWVCV